MFVLVWSDKVSLPEAQTTCHYDRKFFLTYESLPRGVCSKTVVSLWHLHTAPLTVITWHGYDDDHDNKPRQNHDIVPIQQCYLDQQYPILRAEFY